MKNILILAAILVWSGSIQAQDIPAAKVPEVVKNTLVKNEPNPRDIEWEMKGNQYKVEYESGKYDHELWITSSGEVVKHKQDISPAELPQSIKTRIKSDFRNYKIDDAEKLTIGSKVLYKVEIETGRGDNKKEMGLILDESGLDRDNSEWYQTPPL